MKVEFPKMVYSDTEGFKAKFGYYHYKIVDDEAELEAALVRGFRLSPVKDKTEAPTKTQLDAARKEVKAAKSALSKATKAVK
jgi:hypothetical protein